MSDDDDRRRFLLVTEDNASTLVRKDSIAALRADDDARRETLSADNPMRISGQNVDEWSYEIDGCKNRHIYVEGHRDSRLLTCRDCGANVDPMSWLFHAAKPVERLLDAEKHLRHEMHRLEETREEMKREIAKLRKVIAQEQERAAKLGLATEGEKRPKAWRMAPDRIITTDRIAAGVEFVQEHGGIVRVHAEDGSPACYVVHPSLRFVQRYRA